MDKIYKGIEFLRNKLSTVSTRVDMRYKEYDMKRNIYENSGIIPIQIKQLYQATLGWCTKSVDSLADRLSFKGFENDIFQMEDIFKLNNPDIIYDSAILNALIASCAFIYVSKDPITKEIRLQVIEANSATGIIDPITGLLLEGYAVFKKGEFGQPLEELYFTPGRVDHIKDNKLYASYTNDAPYCALVPIMHRPDAVRPFGRSRITRSSMYYKQYAKRTLERAEVTAEFYSFPQKYVTGLSQDAEPMESWKATVSSMLQFTKDDDGDKPTLGQFTTPAMTPFTEQLRNAAALFAGETGLTLDDLGFVSDNPSSSEAIKASHETLRLYARKAQKTFGSGFLNVGYIACCIRDGFPYKRNQFYNVTPTWYPVFEPDSATLSSIGDGAIKINQAIPGYFDGNTLEKLTGIKGNK